MDISVVPLQLGHLMVEGAVIGLSIELAFRCIFAPSNQKSWLVRSLKILMAVCMTIKSSLFSSFSTNALGGTSCKLAGKLADAFFHVSSLAGLYILLLRVMVLVPRRYKTIFIILHCCFLLLRLALGVADTVFAQVWVDLETGICRYKDINLAGVAYTILDLILDLYVSGVVTYILSCHIRNLKAMGVEGNSCFYISIVISNVFRSMILSILNLLCTVYFVASSDNSVLVFLIWPINNLLFIVLIGYDTNITKSLSQLQLFMFQARQKQQQKRTQSSDNHESLTVVLNEPFYALSSKRVETTESYRTSSAVLGGDDSESEIKVSDMNIQNIPSSNPSTTLEMNATTPSDSHT